MSRQEALPSHPSSLRETIFIALDEMLNALEECFGDLTPQQLWFQGPQNRNRVGSLLLHVQENIDCHACYFQIGEWALEHYGRFDFHGKPPLRFQPGEALPAAAVLLERHKTLTQKVFAGLQAVGSDDVLYTPRYAEREYWWLQHRRTSVDAYLRVVGHANAHIRQIWLMRGRMAACSDGTFPHQFYH